MAPEKSVVSTWLDASVAEELKRHAQEERRSISSLVRNLLQDQFETSPAGGDRHPATKGEGLIA